MADRTVVYRLQADVTQFRAQMAAASASAGKTARELGTGLDKGATKAGTALEGLGVNAGTAGLAIGGAVVLAAANFEQAMSNVQAATHESSASMDALRDAALDAGATTAFSASEAAAGIENLAKAGVSTTEILDGGLTGALDLAAAGGMDVASAAEAAAGAMAQFKLEGDQVPHIADLLAAAAGKAQGDVSDMVMALKQAGTVASQTGLTLEETTGSLAAMAEQSLLGSDAGTSFKTMLAALTPNSKKAAQAMEQYNIHAFDAQGNFVGMTELAGQLEAGLGHLTDEQRAVALETIFGSDAVRAASIIYDNGAEGVANWTAAVDDAGYAAETAAIRMDNLKGDVEELKGALETAFITQGDDSQGILRTLTQLSTEAVNLSTEVSSADGVFGDFIGHFKDVAGGPITMFGNKFLEIKELMGDTAPEEAATDATAELAVQQARAANEATILAGAAERSAEEIADQAKALQEARDAARQTAGGFVNLTDALDDSKVSLGQWIRQMANQADALNNFTSNAQKAAKRGLRDGLIAALQDAGTEGALRMKQLANATDAEIARANGAWAKGQSAIDNYVKATTRVPKSVSTKVDVDNRMALASFREVDQMMSNLASRPPVYIDIITRRLGQTPETRAEGGPIFGPGTATSDSIPALLSNGEYVVKAAAVEHYGMGFFDRANAMRLAGGGSTDKKRRRRLSSSEDMESIDDSASFLNAVYAMGQSAERAAAMQENAAGIALLAAQDQLGAAQSMLDSTQQLSDSFESAVSSQFSGSLTGGGLAGLDKTLSGDIAGGAAFDSTLRALVGAGLDTTGAAAGLFQELAASGDSRTASQLLTAGPGAIAQYEAQFAQRAAQNASRGQFAADASYAQALTVQTQIRDNAQASVARLEGQLAQSNAQLEALRQGQSELAGQLADAINSGVAGGFRSGRNR